MENNTQSVWEPEQKSTLADENEQLLNDESPTVNGEESVADVEDVDEETVDEEDNDLNDDNENEEDNTDSDYKKQTNSGM